MKMTNIAKKIYGWKKCKIIRMEKKIDDYHLLSSSFNFSLRLITYRKYCGVSIFSFHSSLWSLTPPIHSHNIIVDALKKRSMSSMRKTFSSLWAFFFGNIIGLRWKFFRKAMSCGVSKERKKLIKGIVTNDFGIFLLSPWQNCFCNNKFQEFLLLLREGIFCFFFGAWKCY